MLEKYIAALLVPYLSRFVENVNEDQLTVSLWGGKATLSDLVLRPEALDALLGTFQGDGEPVGDEESGSPSARPGRAEKNLRLPMRADRGICKNVSLSIPIKHLRSEPVVLEVGELLLTLKSSDAGEDGEEIAATTTDGTSTLRNLKADKWARRAAAKAKELDAFEKERKCQREQMEQQAGTAVAQKGSGGSFFSRLGELVINNMIVKVETVHIRYEDESSETVLGAVLGGVQLLTMNESTGQPMFTDPSGLQRMWKRLVFSDFQLYCDDPSHMRASAAQGRAWLSKIDDWQQWYHRMRQRARDGSVALSTVLGPVSGSADAKVVFKLFVRQLLETPFAEVALQLQYVVASLTRPQYTTLLQLAMRFTTQTESSQLQQLRPRLPIHGHAREWWRYAIRVVRTVLEEPRREELLQRVSLVCRQDYQLLYRDMVRQKKLPPEKKRLYEFVTRYMTTDDMKAGRKCVYAQLASEIQLKRKDNEIRKAEEMAKQHHANVLEEQKQQQSRRGWLGWLVGTRDTASSADSATTLRLTAKEIEEDEKLFASIEQEYGISAADSEADSSVAADLRSSHGNSSLPPSYCWLRASFDLPLMSYRIDTEQGESVNLKLFQLHGSVASFNKTNSMQFLFRTQNITLDNPSYSPASSMNTDNSGPASSLNDGDPLVPYLIEGVQMASSTGPLRSSGAKAPVRSLADAGSGRHPVTSLPTIYDVIDAQEKGGQSSSPAPSPALAQVPSASGATDATGASRAHRSAAHGEATPLFSAMGFLHPVEQPLPDTVVEVAVKMQLLPLRIVADPHIIEHLIRFFTPPAEVDVSGFAKSTKQAATAMRSVASQEVRAAMSKTKGLYMTVDASAPVIVIPKSLTAGAHEPALCVSLGRVRFQARPLSETEKRRRLAAAEAIPQVDPNPANAALPSSQVTDARPAAIPVGIFSDPPNEATSVVTAAEEALVYYPHRAKFSEFYLELTTVAGAMSRPKRGFMIMPEVFVAADILQRIDSSSTAYEAVVMRLRVPSLRLACSVHQTYLITSMVDAWLSHLYPLNSEPAPLAAPLDQRDTLRRPTRAPQFTSRLFRGSESLTVSSAAHALPVDASATERSSAVSRGAASMESGSRPTSPSPPLLPGAPTAAPPTTEVDLPIIRLEMLVEHLGIDVHEDDPDTLAAAPLPSFQAECAAAELILAVRSRHKKLVLWLREPHIFGSRDAAFPIFSGGGARVDVLLTEGDFPTAVAVNLDAAMNVAIGTPCVELLETVMDMVNLILSAMDSTANRSGGTDPAVAVLAAPQGALFDQKATGPASGALPDTDDRVDGDLAYQVRVVQWLCALRNRHVADVFVRVRGPLTITLLNRCPDAVKDTPFVRASVRDLELRLSKYAVTMDLSGHIGQVSASVLESSGLAEENREILTYRSPSARAPASVVNTAADMADAQTAGPLATESQAVARASSSPTSLPPCKERRRCSGSGDVSHAEASLLDGAAHIRFGFRKSRPVMPIYGEVDGVRKLINAHELRFSSALELEVGPSTVTLDVNTVMIFKTYVTDGLLSRVSQLSDRPLYNGHTLPPLREGPRLLMSIRVAIHETLLVLPVDPRASRKEATRAGRFCASLGLFTLRNRLYATEGEMTTRLSLSEVSIWREACTGFSPTTTALVCASGVCGQRAKLSSQPTSLNMVVRQSLDLCSEAALHIAIHSEDLSLELYEADVVQLVTLLRENLTRADPTEIALYATGTPVERQRILNGRCGSAAVQHSRSNTTEVLVSRLTAVHVAVDPVPKSEAPAELTSAREGGDNASSVGSGALDVTVQLGDVKVLLNSGSHELADDSSAFLTSRFQLQSSGVSLAIALPANRIDVQWTRLELEDARNDNSSTLVWCEAGTLHFSDSVSTHDALMRDFGTRPGAASTLYSQDEPMTGLTRDGAALGTQTSKVASAYGAGERLGGHRESSPPCPTPSVAHHGGMPAAAESEGSPGSTEPLSVAFLSADFTLRRFAISDQWLAFYDLLCNEAVVSAWTAAQTGMRGTRLSGKSLNSLDVTADVSPAGASARPKGEPLLASTNAENNTDVETISGMRICITTPSVLIPFLNSRRETLMNANIGALLVDVVQLPTVKRIAVKVDEFSVVDAKSGEKLLSKRPVRKTPPPPPVRVPVGADKATHVPTSTGLLDQRASPAIALDDWADGWSEVDESFVPLCSGDGDKWSTDAKAAVVEKSVVSADVRRAGSRAPASTSSRTKLEEALELFVNLDSASNTNRIQLGIGELEALVSKPIIESLIDYFTSPTEPVLKIASLGVMREQRVRMAAAAQQIASTSSLTLHILWRRPRIVLAGDATQLQKRSGNLEMRLGVMRAAMKMSSSEGTCSVVVRAQEYHIPSLLKRSALHFIYRMARGVESIQLEMERTTAMFHPSDVERMVSLAQHNLLMPSDVNYYGVYEKSSEAAPVASLPHNRTSPGAVAADVAPLRRELGDTTPLPSDANARVVAVGERSSSRTPSRTVHVHMDGLAVAIHDAAGDNTHTLSLAALDVRVTEEGTVSLRVPSFSMTDKATNRCLLQSDVDPSTMVPDGGCRAGQEGVSAAIGTDSRTEGGAASAGSKLDAVTAPGDAIQIDLDPLKRVSNVRLGAVFITVIPRSIGKLVNAFLSVRIPLSTGQGSIASTATAVSSRSPSVASSKREDDRGRSKYRTSTAPPSNTRVAEESELPFLFHSTLTACRVLFCEGDAEAAMLQLTQISAHSTTCHNGASELAIALGSLVMIDRVTKETNYCTFIYACEDAEGGGSGSVGEGAGAASQPNPAAPLDALITYEMKSDAPPSLYTMPKTTVDAAAVAAPTYTQHMTCRVGSLSIILVPDVVRAVAGAVREVQANITAGNRHKAYRYVSDRAAESVRRRNAAMELTEINFLVQRPQILLVDAPTATMGMQLSPGSLVIRSKLVSSSAGRNAASTAAAAAVGVAQPALVEPLNTSTEGVREVVEVHVRKLGMRLHEANCFRQDCNIFVSYERALPVPVETLIPGEDVMTSNDPATRAADMETEDKEKDSVENVDGDAAAEQSSKLRVEVPVFAVYFTREQTDFAMNVLGALVNGSDLHRTVPTTTAALSDVPALAPEPDLAPVPALAVSSDGNMPNACTITRAPVRMDANTQVPIACSLPRHETPRERTIITSFTLSASVGLLQAELADLFRLRVKEMELLRTDVSNTGKTTDVRFGAVCVQHVGSEVEAPPPPHVSVPRAETATESGTPSTTHPHRTTRIQELVDVVTVSKLHLHYSQPPPTVDVDSASSMEESTLSVSAAFFNVAVSPTILFDSREVLYLPFCDRVLNLPIDPVPILRLLEETTSLDDDVVLDDKHVLVTASRTRCCYVLDLRGHYLIVSGSPSAQIVLSEGCEVTITNGTIRIPGMYTIGSYVSFAPSTALFTTSSVRFEKAFQNMPNELLGSPLSSRFMSSPRTGKDDGDVVTQSSRSGGPPSSGGTYTSSSAALSPVPSTGAFAATVAPQLAAASSMELRERTVRLLVNFHCESVMLQMLSEEVVDLSIAFCTQCHVKFVQDNENDVPSRRTVSLQLLNLRSQESEEHILLPTDVVMNVSGVENVSATLVLNSVEFCTRATLLRSLVELGRDFGATFIEETTVKRVKPRIEYETQSLDPLVPVLKAGGCLHCGQKNAYLAPSADKVGILCYKCCTGFEHVPSIDVRVQVPLIDGIVFGSKGDMVHICMRSVLLSVDPSMDLKLTLLSSLYSFSNAAAVWEPFVEQFDTTISGSVNTHDYKAGINRLDYVVSPQNILLLTGMVSDYGDATVLQKQLRKRFRRQRQRRVQQTVPNQGLPMYVDEAILDEDARLQREEEEEELGVVESPDSAQLAPFRPLGVSTDQSSGVSNSAARFANSSIFDVLSTANRRLQGQASIEADATPSMSPTSGGGVSVPPHGYAHVYVTNNCSTALSIDGRAVAAHGGRLRFVAETASVTVSQRGRQEASKGEGYVTSISNAPLYVQTKDMVIETRVVLKQNEGERHLRRTVTIILYPLHPSCTIICVENRLHCPLLCMLSDMPVPPAGRAYVAPTVNLQASFTIQPIHTSDKIEYEPARVGVDAKNSNSSLRTTELPPLQEVLCGGPLILSAAAKKVAAKCMTVVVCVRQEEMRGGVPTFVIAVESRFRLRNKLPYRLIVHVLPDVDGSLAKGKGMSRPVQPLASAVLEVRQSSDLGLNGYDLSQVALMLEVRQRGRTVKNTTQGTGSASLSSGKRGLDVEEEEVFSTVVPKAVTNEKPFVVLRSQYGRQLIIRAGLASNDRAVVFTTPYLLLNHSPIALTLRECTRTGENKMYEAEPNYSTLRAGQSASIAACPIDTKKVDTFFVNVYHEEYCGSCVPLHAQQRGVVILQSGSAAAAGSKKPSASSSSPSGTGSRKTAARTPSLTVIHLAYSSQVDPNGSLLVTITPRWVLVNRSHLPLYVAPSTYRGITAKEAAATAATMMASGQQKPSDDVMTPTQQVQRLSAMETALKEMAAGDSIAALSDAPTQVTALPPQSATTFLETPFCAPEVGYNLHILQDPLSPLYGTPVGIESIHNELIVAYKPLTPAPAAASVSSPNPPRRGELQQRDRFLEVSLVAKDSYTYVILEPPTHAPYLLLNRTGYAIDVRDTATKSAGRLMGRATPGCGAELALDTTVSTVVKLELYSADRRRQLHEVLFDVGRPMTAREVRSAVASAAGVFYTLDYGEFGQQIVEVAPAKAALPVAYTSVAAPPIPLDVLLNMAVLTVSVVMPNADVVFCAVTDIRLNWSRQGKRDVTKFSVENFQMDNQTEPSPRYESCILSLRTSKGMAAASGYLERVLVPAKGLICLEEVRLDVVPVALRVSDTLLVELARFVQAVRSGEVDTNSAPMNESLLSGSTSTVELQEAAAAAYERCPSAKALLEEAPVQLDMWASRLTLEKFIVNPIVVRVWLTRDKEEHDFFRDNIASADAALLSMMVPSCEDVTVAAPGIVTAKQSSRLGIFLQWIGKTYTDELLAQLKGLILQYASSLPLIGVPLKLATGFGNGAVRLFREPIEGLSTSPSAFATGLARGSAGFAQECAGGGLGAFSNLTDTGSRLLSLGGGVSEHERRKQNTLTAFASGLKGVVQRPMEGAAESGAAGLLKGTAQGLIGVLVNPISGLFSDMSRASGTLAKLVTDTYIPETHRLRPIRDFYANGGVAPWRSLASVYQYQRIQVSTRVWAGSHLISSVDGPEWFPTSRENAVYGPHRTPIPLKRWTLDRYHTDFFGWTYSSRYSGTYTAHFSDEARLRRMHWTALVRPLPYSRVATFLRVCPGMETQPRQVRQFSFTAVTTPQESAMEFTTPGILHATTEREAQTRKRRLLNLLPRSRARGSRGGSNPRAGERSSSAKSRRTKSNEFFVEEEYAATSPTIHERMRSLSATGRNVGVKTAVLRSRSTDADGDDGEVQQGTDLAADAAGSVGVSQRSDGGSKPGSIIAPTEGRDMQNLLQPDAPRDVHRRRRSSNSRSNSGQDAALYVGSHDTANVPHADGRGSGEKRRTSSREEERRSDTRTAEGVAGGPGETVADRTAQASVCQSRSSSGRVLAVDMATSVAPVPGGTLSPVPRKESNARAPLPCTIVEVYEYQIKLPLLGWGRHNLPLECPAWQDVHGHEVPRRKDIRAPTGWAWANEWTVVGGDEDGWTLVSRGDRTLRRRLWQRRLTKQATPPP